MSRNVDLPSSRSIREATAALWYTPTDAVTSPELLFEYERLLDRAERRRYEAFRFPTDRHLYLVAHALLRTSLSRYASVAPQDWQFTSEEGQRPEIIDGSGAESPLRFSLSHTHGLAACIIAGSADVGVDVEKMDRKVNAMSIGQRYFSAYESHQLAQLSGGARQERFLEYWTLKEAYVKACGVGLSVPLNDFYFDRNASGAWQINFSREAISPTDAWQFWSARPTPHHIMSIAVRLADERPFDVTIRETVPLGEPSDSPTRRPCGN